MTPGLRFACGDEASLNVDPNSLITSRDISLVRFRGTCRQIHHEVGDLTWTLNTFRGEPGVLDTFLKHRNTKAHLIKHIHVVPDRMIIETGTRVPFLNNLMRRILRVLRELPKLEEITICGVPHEGNMYCIDVLRLMREVLDKSKSRRGKEIRLVLEIQQCSCIGLQHVSTCPSKSSQRTPWDRKMNLLETGRVLCADTLDHGCK